MNLTFDADWTKEEWDKYTYITEVSIKDVLELLPGLLGLFNHKEIDGIRDNIMANARK
jgi:hypothetical protein